MFKKNQLVRVKTMDQIRKTLNGSGKYIGTDLNFPSTMQRYAGELVKVAYMNPVDNRVYLVNNSYSWHPNWLEPVELDNREVRDNV
jgi:hypothetical protein